MKLLMRQSTRKLRKLWTLRNLRNLEYDHRGICGSRPPESQPHKTPELPRQGDLDGRERLRYRHHEKGPLTSDPDYESPGERV